MAGWLSSKLKVAEQFLQQIDHQAAESLGKPEKQRSNESISSFEEKNGNHTRKSIEPFELNHSNQTYFLRQSLDIEKRQNSQPLLSGVKRPIGSAYAQQRIENISSMQRPEIKDQKFTGSKQLSSQVLSVEDSEKDLKDDWTELLASPDFSLVSSAASSVGSSDSGKIVTSRVASSSNPFGTARSDADLQQTSTSALRTFYNGPRQVASLSSESKSHSNSVNGLRNSETTTRNFRHENLRRRLELDASYNKTGERELQDLVVGDEASKICNSGCLELDGHIIQATGEVLFAQGDSVLPSAKMASEGADNTGEEWRGSKSRVDGKVEKDFNVESEVLNNGDGDMEASRMLKSVHEVMPNSSLELFACTTESSSKPNQAEIYACSDSDIIGLSIDTRINKEEQDPSHEESSGQDRLKDEESGVLEIVNHDDTKSNNEQLEEINFYRHGNKDVEEESLESNLQRQVRGDLDIVGQAERTGEFIFRSVGASERDTESYDSGTETDTDSASGSDSELEEIERRRISHKKGAEKKRALALAMAEAAQAAINEREDFVSKLEREKQALENALAVREEQQAREAAELRMTMMEVLQSLDLEKQLHSSSRMKALARESQLENENAELAKSLAAVQWKLEEQMAQVGEARNMVEAKEGSQAEFERKIAKLYHKLSGTEQTQEVEFAGSINVQEILFEEEQNSLWRKIEQYQIQVKELEKKIKSVKDLQHAPTEVEIELENRLAQLTDHLIQKQAQVEGLSAEKATLVFRLEALSNAVQEERSAALSRASRSSRGSTAISNWASIGEDLEYGLGKLRSSKNKFSIYVGEEADAEGVVSSHPCLSLLRQLDALFLAGIYYFRRHRWAQAFAIVYIILLHLWVLFVLLMQSQPDQVARSQDLLSTKNASYSLAGFNATNSL